MKQLLRSGCWGRVGWAVVWTGMALNCPLGLAQGFNRTATKFYPDFSDTADALLRNAASHARDGPVGRGRRYLSACDPAVRRQGRQAAEGRPRGRPDGGIGPVRRPAPVLPATAGGAAARRPARSTVRVSTRRPSDGIARGRPSATGPCSAASSSRRSAAPGATTPSTCSATWRSRTAGSTRRWRSTGSSSPTAPATGPGLIYPDPSVDLARVAAKKLLCRAALGENPPSAAELEAFATAYPNAARRARRPDGPYAETLAEALQARPPRAPRPARRPLADVRRLADADARSFPGPIDVGSLQWRVELERDRPRRREPRPRA